MMENESGNVWVRMDGDEILITYGPVKTYTIKRNGIREVLSKTHSWAEDDQGLFITQICLLKERYKKIGGF